MPVYVLDSWTNFPMAVSTTRLMQWGGEVPPCLVVGIGYADIAIADRDNWRTRDLTPTTDPGDYQPLPGESFGAGPDLRRFLLETLRPDGGAPFRHRCVTGSSVRPLPRRAVRSGIQWCRRPRGFGNYLAISPIAVVRPHDRSQAARGQAEQRRNIPGPGCRVRRGNRRNASPSRATI